MMILNKKGSPEKILLVIKPGPLMPSRTLLTTIMFLSVNREFLLDSMGVCLGYLFLKFRFLQYSSTRTSRCQRFITTAGITRD